jgi:Fe-Mn family superoxide dismutase
MKYEARNFETLLGTEGFSDQLLKNHFKLYEGYVSNTNALLEKLDAQRKQAKPDAPVFGELKRRLGWEWNGMRLHELYFEGMRKGGHAPAASAGLERALRDAFGSRQEWEKDFRAVGGMRGIGWAMLVEDPMTGTLANVWINGHDAGHWAGAHPIIIMDAFEHAYMVDYGVKKDGYIDAFLRAVDWRVAEERFSAAEASKARVPVGAA